MTTAAPLSCDLLDTSLLWILRSALDLAAGGVRVTVAPCGRHFGKNETMVIPWEEVERAELDPQEPATMLGRRLLRDQAGVRLLPPMIAGRRPLLVAPCAARCPWGMRALEGHSGSQLASAVGATLAALLETFETANVLDWEGESPGVGLRRLAASGRLENRVIVAVGESTHRALVRYLNLPHHNARILGWIVHPSRRSLLQSAAATHDARRLLVDAVLETRRRPGLAAAANAARRGEWQGWQLLADAGAASHSPTPGHAWRPRRGDELEMGGDPDQTIWVRRWIDGLGVISQTEKGFEWMTSNGTQRRCGRVATLQQAVQVAEASAMVPIPWREVAAASEHP